MGEKGEGAKGLVTPLTNQMDAICGAECGEGGLNVSSAHLFTSLDHSYSPPLPVAGHGERWRIKKKGGGGMSLMTVGMHAYIAQPFAHHLFYLSYLHAAGHHPSLSLLSRRKGREDIRLPCSVAPLSHQLFAL